MRSDDQTYCTLRYRRLCMGKGSHVACQFPLAGAGASCSNYTKIKFTNVLKHFVTSYINRRRQRIASGSERVRGGAPLPRPEVWDKELAFLAQRLADQCNFVHDDCRATVRYPYAGQSVGEVHWRGTEELSLQRAIRRVLDAWWGERRRVQPEQLITPFRLTNKGSVWGHFSQLAVWSLRAVGCGAVIHGWDYTRLLLVCDFSHTNMLGQRTISPGPLAPCPIHTVRKQRSPYPLLCAPIKRSLDTENEENDLNNDYQNTPDYDGIRDTEITKRYSMNTYKYDETTKKNMLSIPRRYTWLKDSEISDQKTSDLLKHRIKQMKLWNSVRTSINLRKYNRWESWPTHADMRPGAKALLNKPLGKLPQKPSIVRSD
ncbi:gvag protein precursor [Danaus plexippus plexippus]|uniref:Gvag protein n=1 Tax=Danaus plexippus plexippus TaxID=278856 RepID=A0A212EWY6_DANPL|nr:gvag protein precursor [Danaus plexippus plexippus]